MKIKICSPLKGIDNTCVTASQSTTAGESGRTKAPAHRRASRRHPLAVAVRAAEEALEAAMTAEARAIERNEGGDVSHGDEAWENEQAVFDAIDRRERAEEDLRQARAVLARATDAAIQRGPR